MDRLAQLKIALNGCKQLQTTYPASQAIQSIIAQLEYLIALETEQSSDRTRLKDINIGVLAAKEIEDMDIELAEQLHNIAAEVREM